MINDVNIFITRITYSSHHLRD